MSAKQLGWAVLGPGDEVVATSDDLAMIVWAWHAGVLKRWDGEKAFPLEEGDYARAVALDPHVLSFPRCPSCAFTMAPEGRAHETQGWAP